MKSISRFSLLLLLGMAFGFSSQAQTPEKPLSVGIFVYPGVEILDFSGPSEVFASTVGFKTFTVSLTKEPLLSQGFITVTPQYSIDDCPPTDILVFPGGNTGPLQKDPKLIDWIRQRSDNTQFMVSVCTGAALLSKAGLLDGQEATTWHGFIPELQRMTPKAKVHNDTRFVDNGHVITTAGVSAGIDGALHVVSRIKGEPVAHATAFYMEYDKWKPREGKVIESPFLQSVRKDGIAVALKNHPATPGSLQPLFYEGEMTNLANDLLAEKPAQSEAIFQHLIKTLPPTAIYYDGLGAAWKKQGRPAPIDSRTFIEKLRAGEVAWAKKTQREVAGAFPGWLLFIEEDVNLAGYNLLGNKKTKEAMEVFRWNTELYPASANAWDSLAEAYEAAGENTSAVAASEQCLVKAGQSKPANQALLEKISKERIERLKAKR